MKLDGDFVRVPRELWVEVVAALRRVLEICEEGYEHAKG